MSIHSTGLGRDEPGSGKIWCRPREAMRIASIGLTTLYEWLNNGTVESRKIGGARLISVESLRRIGEAADNGENAKTVPPAV